MSTIPIVAISDRKLAFALATLFVNLLETKDQNTFYELNALVTPDFGDDNLTKIKSIAGQYPDQCSINLIIMDHRFDHIDNGTGYIANACAYKMCLAEMFPQYDKVIYLDTDIIVFKDVTTLYQIDLKDNYLGGVLVLQNYLERQNLTSILQIPSLSRYINAGMMLINLAAIRRDNIEPQLQDLIGTYPDSVDQHIYNRVCYPKIKLLPFFWNYCQSEEPFYMSDKSLVAMTREERHRTIYQPAIYHYTGHQKPWQYYDLHYAHIWLRYYQMSPYYDHLLALQSSQVMRLQNIKTFKQFVYWLRGKLAIKRRLHQLFGRSM